MVPVQAFATEEGYDHDHDHDHDHGVEEEQVTLVSIQVTRAPD